MEVAAILQFNQLPVALERYEDLLEIGKAHGHAWRYHNSLEMLPMAVDLLGQQLDFTAEDFSRLCNVDVKAARQIIALAEEALHINGSPFCYQPP